MKKNFSAMILSAGFGKRLLPITNKVPKPLVKINNISLLKNCIDFLFNIGCKKIVVNTHFKHQLIYDFIKHNYDNSNITVLYEKDILDTGGAVKNAMSFFDDENILVTNSDIFWIKKNEIDILKILSVYRICDMCCFLIVQLGNENGIFNGLGWIEGNVEKLKSKNYNLPHIGWQSIEVKKNLQIVEEVSDLDFYFLHSYIFKPKLNENIVASTNYGENFCSIINKNNIFGTQFHPEKSQQAGMQIIKNFMKYK